ncbi:MAG: pyrroloquinoline quinone biosynthesis protein PqqE [Gemmatimonadaceae bacterium]
MDRRPTTLLAELTHRCPLHCPYCSNPIDLARSQSELSTDDWKRVFTQARELGALQLGLSGGEPLIRRDLEELVAHASSLGFYQTLVTSALGLTRERAVRLKEAGLEHVQISFQDSEKEIAEKIAGTRSWDAKLQAAQWIKELDFAFSVNVVLHRSNLDHLAEIIDMAAALGADRIELANTQYYGWAVLNHEALMPTRAQIERSEAIVDAAVQKYKGTMQIIYVLPDYYSDFPKPCQGGWGNFYLVVAPDGRTMPCHAASQITTLSFDNVRDHSVRWIWEESSAFLAYRGDDWMKEPCRSCPRKHVDFGGCRCQAFALTGDATRTDPVCTLTSDRAIIDAMLDGNPPPIHYVYREMVRTRGIAMVGASTPDVATE